MFYDNFLSICEERGISPSRLLVDLGISKSSLQRWRTGGEPTNPIKKKLADRFEMSVPELMQHHSKTEKPATNKGDELSSDELQLLAMRRLLPSDSQEMLGNLAKMLLRGQK